MRAYRVIVADPPWSPRDKLPGKTRGAARQYDVLSRTEIMCFLAERQIQVADDAILFLWRLASMQRDAIEVAEAWGFDVKSEVVWQKLTRCGWPHFGMGRTVRASHETCLIAVRGRASKLVRSKNVRSIFNAPTPSSEDNKGKAIHSAKPPEFFAHVVEPLVGPPRIAGPCLELFARQRREGWDAIGNQLPRAA